MQNDEPELIRQWQTNSKLSTLALKIFFATGERLALIFLLLAAMVVLSIQNSDTVYSEKKQEGIEVTYSQIPTATPTPIPPTPTPTDIPTPTPIPPAPTPRDIPTPTPLPVDPNDNSIWDKIADCESHQNWGINSGNGYFGGLQFTEGAWNSVGGQGLPSAASRDEQIQRGKMLQAQRGWGAWGECAHRLGLN